MGVNKFATPYTRPQSLLNIDPEEAEKQVQALNEVKRNRDDTEVKTSLENLREVALGQDNTMPTFIRCVAAYATVGEICDTLRQAFGIQKESLIF